MFQYLGKALQQVSDFFLNTPQGRQILQNSVRIILTNPEVRRQMGQGVEFVSERFQEFVASIQLKIDFSKKEAQFVLNVEKKYYAGQLERSVLAQGENISLVVNNYVIVINPNKESIQNLEKVLEELKLTEKNIETIVIRSQENSDIEVQKELASLNEYVNSLSQSVKDTISKLTDYPNLKKALETDQISGDVNNEPAT